MTGKQWRRKVADICREFDFIVDGLTANGHYRLKHRTARLCFTSSTPSDIRSAKNLRSELRRATQGAA